MIKTKPVINKVKKKDSNNEPPFIGIDANDEKQNQITMCLKKFQRVLRLTPDYAESKILIDVGLDSAFKITRLPKFTVIAFKCYTCGYVHLPGRHGRAVS